MENINLDHHFNESLRDEEEINEISGKMDSNRKIICFAARRGWVSPHEAVLREMHAARDEQDTESGQRALGAFDVISWQLSIEFQFGATTSKPAAMTTARSTHNSSSSYHSRSTHSSSTNKPASIYAREARSPPSESNDPSPNHSTSTFPNRWTPLRYQLNRTSEWPLPKTLILHVDESLITGGSWVIRKTSLRMSNDSTTNLVSLSFRNAT